MQRPVPSTFATFVSNPENRCALAAVRHVADALATNRVGRLPSLLFLHGPTGTGKSHLAAALATDVARCQPTLAVCLLFARDLALPYRAEDEASDDVRKNLQAAHDCDLLLLDDLHQLPAGRSETLVSLLDELQSRQVPILVASAIGPSRLEISSRLRSRLAGGLVVALEPWSCPSRLAILQDRAHRRQLLLSESVLKWLSEHLVGGGRQLEGALNQIQAHQKLHRRDLDLTTIAELFREQANVAEPSVDFIAQRVSAHFHLEAGLVRSLQRARHVALPRQVSMYLARKLTELSLKEIGAYFGGRDHSTVLHACRKVEQTMKRDVALSGTVRQLSADLE